MDILSPPPRSRSRPAWYSVLIGVGILVWCSLVGGIVYVAYHFVSKFW